MNTIERIKGIANIKEDKFSVKFDGLSSESMRNLLAEGFIKIDSHYNFAPATGMYLYFMEHDGLNKSYAYGYIQENQLTIEGIYVFTRNPKTKSAFKECFAGANDLTVQEDYCLCWYD